MWFAGPAPMANSLRHGGLNSGLYFEKGQTIGLFGGSFNPAHSGHAHVAETARLRLGLDRVVWLVSPQNPLKSSEETAPLDSRIKMIAPFVARGDQVSDFESRIKARYTLDTIKALKARFKGVHFVWIMGADSLENFHKWRGWLQIAHMVPIAIISRPGALLKSRTSPMTRRLANFRMPSRQASIICRQKPPLWVYLTAPLNAQSSTRLRAHRKWMDRQNP